MSSPYNNDVKSALMARDFFWEVSRGNVPGHRIVHKFGHNGAVTALTPVCDGGVYQTPTAAVTIAAISDDVDDTAAGAGAQQLTIEYLDSDFVEQIGTLEMNGTTETTETILDVLRIVRAYVSRSGTYATSAAGSQQGTITFKVASAGATWGTIPEIGVSGMGVGQSLIGAYTVPAGHTAYVLTTQASVEVSGTKSADIYFFARSNADDVTTPFSGAMRMKSLVGSVAGVNQANHKSYEAYAAKTDIGFMAFASSSAAVSVDFEMLLVADGY